MTTSAGRLDSFTDAAFAFAVSLLVIGGAGAPADFRTLVRALGDIPAFAFGFAIVVLFWFAHVRWRRLRGEGDWRSLCLTLLLVFLVLIYIQPLRAMAAATAIFFTGQGGGFRGNLADLFAVYGTGFVADVADPRRLVRRRAAQSGARPRRPCRGQGGGRRSG